MQISEILNESTQKLDSSAYAQDAALVKKHTGAELTEEQFGRYKDKFTLREAMGTDSEIHNEFHAYGISSGFSAMGIMNDILSRLANVDVVFDIEGGQNEVLFQKLSQAATLCLTQRQWPRVVSPYKDSPRLNRAVKEMRSQMQLQKMECVI